MSGKRKATQANPRDENKLGHELTLRQVLEINQALTGLSQRETCMWYAVNKNLRRIKPHLNEIQEIRKDINSKFDANEKGHIVDDEKRKEANKIFTEALESEKVTIDFYEFYLTDDLIKESHPSLLLQTIEGLILIDPND